MKAYEYYKIDQQYDEQFGSDNAKLGFKEIVGNETEKILNEHEHKLFVQTYKQAWNAAIKAAALIVQPNPHVDEERRCEDIAEQIRKLKK